MLNSLNNLETIKNLMPEGVRDLIDTTNKIANTYYTAVYETNVKFAQDMWAIWGIKR